MLSYLRMKVVTIEGRESWTHSQGICISLFHAHLCLRAHLPWLLRFDKDYDLKDCLGRGGFGVVYHVKNRTDGGEYAVKKIKLPSMLVP